MATSGVYARGKRSWRIVVSTGRDPATGKPTMVRETVVGTKKDALNRRAAILTDLNRGTYSQAGPESVPAFLERWVAHREQIGKLRPKTAQTYRGYVAHHVSPNLGHLRLGEVRPKHLQKVLDDALDAGLSPRSVLQIHRILHAAFRQAVRWGDLAVNPADGVTPPETKRPKLTIPTPEQVASILTHAEERYRLPLAVAASTGLRRGELAALRWSKVELDADPSVTVDASLQWIGGKLTMVPPKTERGYRTVPLSASVVALLRRHRRQQHERRLIVGPAWRDGDYLFDSGYGKPMEPDALSHAFIAATRAAGLPGVRLHDLRHAYLTKLVESDVPISLVSQMAGHATASFTISTYVHHDAAAGRIVADAVEDTLGEALQNL